MYFLTAFAIISKTDYFTHEVIAKAKSKNKGKIVS